MYFVSSKLYVYVQIVTTIPTAVNTLQNDRLYIRKYIYFILL